jgi:ATP-dependent DNA ligase
MGIKNPAAEQNQVAAGSKNPTAEDMSKCRWQEPRPAAAIELAEWTPANHLRHSKSIALREDQNANDVRGEPMASED